MTNSTDTSKGQPVAVDVERRSDVRAEEEQKSFRLLDNRHSFKLIR